MVNYREILRLTSLGYSQRQIAASVHSSRSTISEVQALARKVGLTLPLDDSITNEVLLKTFYPERITATNTLSKNGKETVTLLILKKKRVS